MPPAYYHGTTAVDWPKIKAAGGLRPGSWVTPCPATAAEFAVSRAEWNGSVGVVLLLVGKLPKMRKLRNDRRGRPERQTKGLALVRTVAAVMVKDKDKKP